MPKLKTRRGAAKRFRLTGQGKVRRQKVGKSHILTEKTRKRKRRLRKSALGAPADVRNIKKMIKGR